MQNGGRRAIGGALAVALLSVLSSVVRSTEIIAFLFFCSLPLYFIGSWVFARFVLRTGHLPRQLFAVSFALSLSLLALVLAEVLDVLGGASRWILWRLVLLAHVILLVLGMLGLTNVWLQTQALRCVRVRGK